MKGMSSLIKVTRPPSHTQISVLAYGGIPSDPRILVQRLQLRLLDHDDVNLHSPNLLLYLNHLCLNYICNPLQNAQARPQLHIRLTHRACCIRWILDDTGAMALNRVVLASPGTSRDVHLLFCY